MLSKFKNIEYRIKNIEVERSIYVLCSIFYSLFSQSQCAMCRASLQNEANKSVAEGVNDGIVYLMAIPYILVAGVFYAVWRLKQKKKKLKRNFKNAIQIHHKLVTLKGSHVKFSCNIVLNSAIRDAFSMTR